MLYRVARWIGIRQISQTVLWVCYLALGGFLITYAWPSRVFNDIDLIYDLMWLDVWVIAFLVLAVAIWLLSASTRLSIYSTLLAFSIFGVVTTCLVFAGTDYSINGFSGDQQFRQAMILKFMTWGWLGDFYYKDLPVFYPPLYYFLLSIVARLMALEAVQMLKVGSMLIYLLGPFALFWLWRKVVSPVKAFCITVATFLICSSGSVYPYLVPHAFLADSAFIPWWLHYVEGVNRRSRRSWLWYAAGSVIGGCLFATYFYAFFIGGFLLLVRGVAGVLWRPLRASASHFDWWRAVRILVGAAVVSAPFWLPLFLSIAEFGGDRSRGGWHHAGNTGIRLAFMNFTIPGVLFLTGIGYCARRYRTPLSQGLLLLLGAAVLFLGVGSLLGGLDMPINRTKTPQFVLMMAGPFVGLLFASLLRLGGRLRKVRLVVLPILLTAVLILTNGFTGVARSGPVRRARTAGHPTWNTDAQEMADRVGSVFLSGHSVLSSFYPVYGFMSMNEHYSHPASRFLARHNLLCRLQEIDDPALFHLALRHNAFDAIDYFMPLSDNGKVAIQVNLSNYPNRHCTKRLFFAAAVVLDTLLFEKVTGDLLYEVRPVPEVSYELNLAGSLSDRDSLMALAQARSLRSQLDEVGQDLLDTEAGVDWSGWSDMVVDGGSEWLGGKVNLLNVSVVADGDSLHLFSALQATKKLPSNYRAYLHVYKAGEAGFASHDFQVPVPTARWEQWDIHWCRQSIPRPPNGSKIHLGLFDDTGPLGSGFWGTVHVVTSDR